MAKDYKEQCFDEIVKERDDLYQENERLKSELRECRDKIRDLNYECQKLAGIYPKKANE